MTTKLRSFCFLNIRTDNRHKTNDYLFDCSLVVPLYYFTILVLSILKSYSQAFCQVPQAESTTRLGRKLLYWTQLYWNTRERRWLWRWPVWDFPKIPTLSGASRTIRNTGYTGEFSKNPLRIIRTMIIINYLAFGIKITPDINEILGIALYE